MPTYIVQAIAVSSPDGVKEWYCIVRTSDGTEIARSNNRTFADAICAMCVTAGEP